MTETNRPQHDRLAKNNAYYDRFVGEVKNRTDKRDYSHWITAFAAHLDPAVGTVLDIGCGVGLHLKAFRDLGYPVLGLEPSLRTRELAAAEGLPVIDGSFEALDTLDLPPLSGIWCAATLLHVPQEELQQVTDSLAKRLAHGQPLFVTVRLGEGGKWDRYDDQSGDAERFIQLYTEAALSEALTGSGFRIHLQEIEDSYWGRPSRWISLIALKN